MEKYQEWETLETLETLERNIENDPLYMAVINAKNAQERERAVKTLSAIRGSTAVPLLIQYLKKKNSLN